MHNVKAILFDLGGVLVELTGVPAMLGWSKLGLDEKSLWQRWLHSPTVRAFETGLLTADDFAAQLIDEMQLTVMPEQFLTAFTAWPKGLYDGVPALLQQLRPQFTLACLSNTSALHWPRLMDEMKLADHLDHHFASHLIGKIKPDKDCFEHTVEALQLSPEQILFFDDNRINVDAASDFGLQAQEVKGIADVKAFLREQGLQL